MDGKGGLSAKSVREMQVILRKALGDAVGWGLVVRNLALLADPPSHRTATAARQATMRTWTPEQLLTFLKHVVNRTGFRGGCGLPEPPRESWRL